MNLQGGFPIAGTNNSSLTYTEISFRSFYIKKIEKIFIYCFNLIKYKYGGCSLMAECGTVAPETWVRFPPFAFLERRR